MLPSRRQILSKHYKMFFYIKESILLFRTNNNQFINKMYFARKCFSIYAFLELFNAQILKRNLIVGVVNWEDF